MATVEGLDKLKARINAMPGEVRKEISAAIEKSATELVAQMKRFVPVDKGDLRDSIRWDWVGGGADFGAEGLKMGRAAQLATKGNANLAAVVTAGNDKVYYARFVEFGTAPGKKGSRRIYQAGTGGSGLSLSSTESGGRIRSRKAYRTHPGNKAQPYFFTAYRLLKKRMQSRISRAMNKAIKKAFGK